MISNAVPAIAQPLLARLAVRLEDERRHQSTPGLAVTIAHNQRILFDDASGYAILEQRVPTTTDTVFRIGSVTKLFTALMLMQMCDRGRLQLEDSVVDYLPLPDRWRTITFRQLAAHTSGLPREAPLDYFDTMVFPEGEEIVASLEAVTPIAEPGTKYHYSNLGYAVLARALEEITVRPYKDYVRQHILLPLGMERSGFDLAAADRALAAVGYAPVEPAQPAGDLDLDIGGFAAAGQMYSSVADMCRFFAWWFDGTDRVGVLSTARRQEMLQPFFASAAAGREQPALGWELAQVERWTVASQNGRTFGYAAGVSLIPEAKLGLTVLTNSGGDPSPLIHLCQKALVQLAPIMEEGARENR